MRTKSLLAGPSTTPAERESLENRARQLGRLPVCGIAIEAMYENDVYKMKSRLQTVAKDLSLPAPSFDIFKDLNARQKPFDALVEKTDKVEEKGLALLRAKNFLVEFRDGIPFFSQEQGVYKVRMAFLGGRWMWSGESPDNPKWQYWVGVPGQKFAENDERFPQDVRGAFKAWNALAAELAVLQNE